MLIDCQRAIFAAAAALTILTPAACVQSQESPNDATVEQEISNESLEVLGEVVSQYVAKDQAVGAELLVMRRGEVLFHKSFGFADRESERRWENDTICNIRSMTKPITAAAAQLLIDRDLLRLDDPVAKYLDSFDNEQSRSITVRQVLTHRSGFPLTNLARVDQYASLTEQVAAAGKKGPEFKPDSKFWYSDVGTDIVGALVETISGQPLHEFVTQEILEPLGMADSFYGIDGSDKRFSSIASLYLKDPKGWKRFWKPEDKPFYPFAWGSQTIYSTPSDYAKFLTLVMNNGRVGDRQLLSPAAVLRMLEPVSKMKMMGSDAAFPTGFQNLEVYYGQMMVSYRSKGKPNDKPVVLGHSGSDGTYAWAWPQQDLIVMFFTQSRGTLAGGELESAIDRLLIRGDITGFRKEMLAKQAVETSLAQYEGIYWDEDAEAAYYAVIVDNDELVIERPGRFRAVATPQSGEN